jgi:hypothetical protein
VSIKSHAYFRYTCIVLAMVAVAYVMASAKQFPLSLVALAVGARENGIRRTPPGRALNMRFPEAKPIPEFTLGSTLG